MFPCCVCLLHKLTLWHIFYFISDHFSHIPYTPSFAPSHQASQSELRIFLPPKKMSLALLNGIRAPAVESELPLRDSGSGTLIQPSVADLYTFQWYIVQPWDCYWMSCFSASCSTWSSIKTVCTMSEAAEFLALLWLSAQQKHVFQNISLPHFHHIFQLFYSFKIVPCRNLKSPACCGTN